MTPKTLFHLNEIKTTTTTTTNEVKSMCDILSG